MTWLSAGSDSLFSGSSVKSVQQQDAGQYWCEVEFHGLTFSSRPAWITVEGESSRSLCWDLLLLVLPPHSVFSAGVPHFIQEPQDVATFPNTPFNLSCAAVGPPEPVEVQWWLGGVREEESRLSPSALHIPGESVESWEL